MSKGPDERCRRDAGRGRAPPPTPRPGIQLLWMGHDDPPKAALALDECAVLAPAILRAFGMLESLLLPLGTVGAQRVAPRRLQRRAPAPDREVGAIDLRRALKETSDVLGRLTARYRTALEACAEELAGLAGVGGARICRQAGRSWNEALSKAGRTIHAVLSMALAVCEKKGPGWVPRPPDVPSWEEREAIKVAASNEVVLAKRTARTRGPEWADLNSFEQGIVRFFLSRERGSEQKATAVLRDAPGLHDKGSHRVHLGTLRERGVLARDGTRGPYRLMRVPLNLPEDLQPHASWRAILKGPAESA